MRKKERNLRSLDMRRTLLVTLPFAGALAFWQAYDGIIPLILRDTFHLGDTLAGAVMALDNVCALFLLPFFGSISDRCHSRLGRRTPFILVGSLLAALLRFWLLRIRCGACHFSLRSYAFCWLYFPATEALVWH